MEDENSTDVWISKGDALHNKGVALWDDDKYEEAQKCFKQAIKCFDKAIEIDPNDGIVWYSKGIVLNLLGELDEAQKCLDKCEELA